MSIKIKSFISMFFQNLSKKEKTKEQCLAEIESLIKRADVDYAKKRIKIGNTIHEYEQVRQELLLSKSSLEKQIDAIELSIISNDPVMEKVRNMEMGMKILSLRNIIKNIDDRICQIDSFVSSANEALLEQSGRHIEICTNLRMKKTDLISFETMSRSNFDNSIMKDINEISSRIESDIDEIEMSRQAEKIFLDSISGERDVGRVIADDAVENVLNEVINRRRGS